MLIFLDLETTGLEKEDKVCSLAIIYEDIKSKYEIVNEGKKITPSASSVNHITNEILQGKSSLVEGEIVKFLTLHNNVATTIVGHNVSKAMQKLAEVGFIFKGGLIDTQRVTKHLIQECESYSLQFLRYELKLYKDEESEIQKLNTSEILYAHHALSDALNVKLLYVYLLDTATQEKMYELSFTNVLIEKFEFGKYKGRYIEEIYENDRGYLEWMMSNMNLDDDLQYSISYYLDR